MHHPLPLHITQEFNYDGQPTRARLYFFGQVQDEPGYTGRDLETLEFRIFASDRMADIESTIVQPVPGPARSTAQATAAVLVMLGQLLSIGDPAASPNSTSVDRSSSSATIAADV